jgi:bud site selection protein 20
MGRIARKRMHKNIRDNQRKFRTRKRTKDLDQIQEDLLPQNVNKLKDQLAQDPDLPGMGQFYCVECR